MKKLYFIFILLFLFSSIGIVKAQPPFQESATSGLQIEYQKFEYFQIGNSFQVNAHVYNQTGYPLDNTTVTCYFHAYNRNGTHAIDVQMDYDSQGIDFFYDIPGEAFTGGKASWIISCNTSAAGGFASGPAIITPTGFELMDGESRFYYVMLFSVFLLFTLFIAIFLKTPYENEKELTRDGWAVTKITKGKYIKAISFWIAYGLFLWFITIVQGMANNYIIFEGLKEMIKSLWLFMSLIGKGLNFGMVGLLIWMSWNDLILNKKILKEGKALLNGKY